MIENYSQNTKQDNKTNTLAIVLIATLWICTRPYYGIWHDAVIYSGQALRILHPELFANDLFFFYGSQDNYTLFTNIYAYVISLVGMETGALLLALLGQTIWLTGAIKLARRLLPDPLSWIALAAIVTLVSYYSDYSIFKIGETFVTPRPYAEGLSMLAIASLIDKRLLLSGLSLLAALILHPLNALPGVIFVFYWIFRSKPVIGLLTATIVLIAIIALATLGLPPFSALFQSIDPLWFTITSERSPHLYSTSWGTTYWNGIFITISLLGITAFRSRSSIGVVSTISFITAMTGIFLAWCASESLQSLLLVQLQTWRVMWLAQVVGMISAVWLLWSTQHTKRNLSLILGLIASVLYIESIGGIIAISTLAYAMIFNHLRNSFHKWIRVIFIALAIMGTVELVLIKYIYFSKTLPVTLNNLSSESLRYVVILLSITCLAAVAKAWPRTNHRIAGLAFIAILSLGTALSLWDKRNSPTISQAAVTDSKLPQVKALIKENENVYWVKNSATYSWLLLGRPSYYSSTQTAGAIFNRKTAVEAYRRHRNVSTLYSTEDTGSSMRHTLYKESPELTLSDIHKVCSDTKLDWLMLLDNLPGSKFSYSDRDLMTWYAYYCPDFRHTHGKPSDI